MTEDIFETPSSTSDFQTELAQQLANLVPEAVADGKIDVLKLQELLSQDSADASERFGLFWPGKQSSLRAAQMPTTATLAPDVGNSKDWDVTKNLLIEGDNLEVLKIMQKHYHGKIKMIYIDPPYNTGKDFIYRDNFSEGIGTYLEWTKQVNEEGQKISTNSETSGRYHSNWLNMMYPRLKLARNLLTDDGLIFISIDDNELAHLTRVCYEIFGEGNYLNTIVWHYGKMSNEQSKLPNNHEYVLVFKKSAAGGIFEKIKKEDSEYRNRYIRHLTPQNTVLYGSMKSSEDNLIKLRVKKVLQELGKEELSDDDVLFDFNKEFKSHSDVIYASTIKGNADENVKEFDTGQKPVALMKLLLQLGAPHKDDVVLDFFAGSGSTADALMQLNSEDGGNRKFVLVQIPEPVEDGSLAAESGFGTIADLTRHRISRAGEKISESQGILGNTLDLGFRSYKLAPTRFAKWQLDSSTEVSKVQQQLFSLRDSAEDASSEEELLTEILIKQGHSLSESVTTISVAGLSVRSIGEGVVLAYLNENVKPSLDALREVLSKAPAKFIILEDAFQGDDELKTNLAQLCRSKNIELWTA
jgi:adenine-specific DNA-methyltransferase